MDTPTDYTEFYAMASEQLPKASEYLKAHGIPMETAEALKLGYYDPATMAEAKAALEGTGLIDPCEGPTLIVPFSAGDLGDIPYWEGIDMSTDKPVKPNIDAAIRGMAILSAADIYDTDHPRWLAESIPDLLALKALDSAAFYIDTMGQPELENRLREHPSGMPIILRPCIPENDEDSERMKALAADYRAKGIPATVPDPEQVPKGWAGAAAMLMAAPGELWKFVEGTEKAVIEGRTWERQIYESYAVGNKPLTEFWDTRMAASVMDAVPTGLDTLDNMLDGGFYPGLYIVGAVSSLGKTSLMLQIADTISSRGKADVLFFTAEQSANELIAKSLSRISGSMAQKGGMDKPIPSRRILKGDWAGMDRATLEEAAKKYRAEAGRLWIIEDDESRDINDVRIGMDTIRNKVKAHVKNTGRRPVVFIDYLQIIQTDDDVDPTNTGGSKSDKQRTDTMVSELRRLSKTEQIPIIAVSSLNRSAYNGMIGMDAFKESGSIEYGADVIMALQPRGLEYGDEGADRKKNKKTYQSLENNPHRLLEVHIMKNRMGTTGKAPLIFEADYGLFKSG